MKKETATQRKRRLEKARQKYLDKKNNENNEAKRARLDSHSQYEAQRRAAETPKQRAARLALLRKRKSQYCAAETCEEREIRLEHRRQQRQVLNASCTEFEKAINKFCDSICEICAKRCYPNQVATFRFPEIKPSYLPNELKQKNQLLLCRRCKSHVSSRKTTAPPKAYWNNLQPGPIPDCIKKLSQSEQRLLSRIIPFVKIIKLDGLYGQYGFKGQAILFAQDIFEVSDKLPHMLPRSVEDSGIVVVTECLENLNVIREFSISRTRLFDAIHWLIDNNPLYRDVTIDHNVQLDERALIRITEQIQKETTEVHNEPQQTSFYISINNVSRILRASWHQGNMAIFTSPYAGVQCCAMVLANIVRASVISPSTWTNNTLDRNMIEGDNMCTTIHNLTEQQENAYPIEGGYLLTRNFDVVKHDFIMYEKSFSIEYDEEPLLFGSIEDLTNRGNAGLMVREALSKLFETHSAGIMIAAAYSYGVMNYDDKFYFTDSHSCGPKGSRAGLNGRACVIECDTLEELTRICKRATGSRNIQYTIDYISVHIKNDVIEDLHTQEEVEIQQQETNLTQLLQTLSENIEIQTSLMAPIDCVQPDVEDELEVHENVNEIRRKTRDNIVNVEHELKAEELAWFFLFPYGINGLKQSREVKITPLDYFQSRVLGRDLRFQRNDYLFYALSMFEYYRLKSTIAACGRTIEGQEGMVDDVHLYIKNLRGSSAYWRAALNELIAQIRCLGPPSYFITFSCNDLHWLDMKRALLIADGRPNKDPSSLDVHATQRLIEQYPVIVSRHFMIRVKALMMFVRSNDQMFGGKLKDFWWRIEFQNRGSPHLHMVVWIENHPSFETPEGIRVLDEVCTCEMPSNDDELYNIVKKCQVHHHTPTCQKNNTDITCRFSFPRQTCIETRIIAHSSDEFIRNGGRICLLKRRQEDRWVNNYNRTLLKLWQANMDIQPCGSNESIAYYIAKYISKTEPTELNASIARAIQQIRREETNISRRLFKICMRLMNERQVSASECAFRLCHLNLRESSKQCVFLNTRKPEQRYKVLKFDESGHATGYCANIFERYEKRPLEHQIYDFNNMSLMEYAMTFQPHYAKRQENNEDSIDQDAYDDIPLQKRKQLITLIDNSKMSVRNAPAVVRVPYFMATSDPENFYYSLLLQYMPYRSEQELLEGFNSTREAFLAREETLKTTSEHMETFRQRDRQLENAFNQIHAFDILDAEPIEMEEEIEEVMEQQMDDVQFQQTCQAMNVGQREIFQTITQSIRNQLEGSSHRERLFITGQAGTGKTFLFNLLKNQVNRCYGKQAVKVGALTGVAARLVGGLTLHSLLKLPVQKNGKNVRDMPMLSGNYLRLMRQEWKNIEFFFIDEISMVPYEMLCMIDSRMKQLKNNIEPFGGINILVFGDLMQLPPVRGKQVFQQPERLLPATHFWRLLTLVELKENMRQHSDTTFIDILNALRVGELTANHIASLMDKVNTNMDGEFAIERALRIYPTNQQVNDHNRKVLEHFRSKGTEIFKIRAQDQLVDASRPFRDDAHLDTIIPNDINNTGGLSKELEIFVGANVMLRSNIDVSRGLVNGAIGFVTEIIWPHFRRGQLYENDIPSVRIDFGRDGSHVIQPKAIQFPALYSYGTAERRMLPLILSWASTVHKMQGSTVDYAVVYLGPKLFAEGQAYVSLSRVRSLDGLRIEELDNSKLTGRKPCNNDALSEMDRMRNL